MSRQGGLGGGEGEGGGGDGGGGGGEGEGGGGEGDGGGGGGDGDGEGEVAQAPAQHVKYWGLAFLKAILPRESARTVQSELAHVVPEHVPQSEPPGPLPAAHSR